MSNIKHTPGPWETACTSTSDDKLIYDVCLPDGGDMIADLAGCFDEQTQEANAKLIASAPELLEALKECLSVMPTNDPLYAGQLKSAFDQAMAAIQKATE